VPLAIGTDTAGSARHPASACGIVGFKPGFGRISCAGVVPLARSLDHVGILARSAVDCATAYELIAEPGEPRNEAGSGVAGLRIGYVRHFHESDMPADPEVSAALNDAAARLIDAGAEVETVRLPSLDQFAITNRLILQSEGWAAHGAGIAARPGDYSALTRRALLPGAFLTAADMDAAVRLRRRLTAALDVALGRVDVLLCASSMTLPCRLDDAGGIAATYMRQARTPFNLGGHPAITLPAGVAVSGLPLSIQLAAGHGREAMLLRAAAGWESIGRGFVPPPVDFPISPSAP
jgi:aspartyl-tRNA(Asn)/glutamyl-tRNA(Gln) amidotransferase subunit A